LHWVAHLLFAPAANNPGFLGDWKEAIAAIGVDPIDVHGPDARQS